MREQALAFHIVCIFSCLVFLIACHSDPREQRRKANEVVLGNGANPKTLDPALATDVYSGRAIMPFMRGLTILDTEGKPQPDIAERWTVSDDGRVYDFYLRDTRWTNGDPVTAGDFVYAWIDRALNPALGAEEAYQFFYIEGAKDFYEKKTSDPRGVGVEAVSDRHLRVRLTAPAPFFPQLTALYIYYPVCASVDRANHDWAVRPETYVGNGPFKLVSFSTGDRLVGVKHDGYWNAPAVAMKKVTLRFTEDAATERIAFDNGEIDGTYHVAAADVDQLRGSPTLKIAREMGTLFLSLNMNLPIFADVRVRRALALSIDRASIVKNVTRSDERPALGLVPPELYGGDPATFLKDAQFEEARRLLAEAGYPGGKGFPKLHYLFNTLEIQSAIAQVLQETWKRELGIDLVLDNQEFKVFIDSREEGKFEIARNGWLVSYADPLSLLELSLSDSTNNDSKWKDARYDSMINQAKVELDAKKRLQLLHDAEAYLLEQAPVIPIYFYTHAYLCAHNLAGFDQTPMGDIDVTKLRWMTDEELGPSQKLGEFHVVQRK